MSAAFQAGCRHRLAGQALPPPDELRTEWGLSALDAEKFIGGYELTRLTQDTIAGGTAALRAERELWDMLSKGTSLLEARERLARLIALRSKSTGALVNMLGATTAATHTGVILGNAQRKIVEKSYVNRIILN